jgi:phage gp37-like protein
MEALIQVVVISPVQHQQSALSRRLSLVAAVYVDWHGLEEVQLFHGAVAELGTESRFVVAVPDDTRCI